MASALRNPVLPRRLVNWRLPFDVPRDAHDLLVRQRLPLIRGSSFAAPIVPDPLTADGADFAGKPVTVLFGEALCHLGEGKTLTI